MGAQELGFQLFLRRHVRVDRQHLPRPAVVVAQQSPAAEQDQHLARLADLVQFAGPMPSLQEHRLGGLERGGIYGGYLVNPASHRVRARHPVEPLRALIPVGDAVRQITHINGVVGGIQQGGLPAHLLLGLDALQCLAAMIGQALQRSQVGRSKGIAAVTLDGQDPAGLAPLADGDKHERGGRAGGVAKGH